MTEKSKNNLDTVATRLVFQPSPKLDSLLKNFLRPEVRQSLTTHSQKVSLFSKEVAHLKLIPGNDQNVQDLIAIDKYENSVLSTSHHEYALQPDIGYVDARKNGIGLNFHLFLRPDERSRLVQPPLFGERFSGDIGIYRYIRREFLKDAPGLDIAYSALRANFGKPDPDSDFHIAPSDMFVTKPSILQKFPYRQSSVVDLTSRIAESNEASATEDDPPESTVAIS